MATSSMYTHLHRLLLASAILFANGIWAAGCSRAPTCENAVDRLLEIADKSGDADVRAYVTEQCNARWGKDAKACLVAASTEGESLECQMQIPWGVSITANPLKVFIQHVDQICSCKDVECHKTERASWSKRGPELLGGVKGPDGDAFVRQLDPHLERLEKCTAELEKATGVQLNSDDGE